MMGRNICFYGRNMENYPKIIPVTRSYLEDCMKYPNLNHVMEKLVSRLMENLCAQPSLHICTVWSGKSSKFIYCLGTIYANSLTDISMICSGHALLTLKEPAMNAADDIDKYFFLCFSEKIRLDVSSEIHMKNQALFSSKDKSKKITRSILKKR